MTKEELFDYLNNHVEEWSIDYVQKIRGVARDVLNSLSDSVISEEEIEEYLRQQESLFIERMNASMEDVKAEIEHLLENGSDQKEGILSKISDTFNEIYHKMAQSLRDLIKK